jgi:putative N6-adenine-specific DNA methylase
MNTQRYILTCQSGLESLVKRECEKLGLNHIHVQDRLVEATGSNKQLYELLIWSRFANRVYIELGRAEVRNFDTLYTLIDSIDWEKYLDRSHDIIIDASSTRSDLSSVPAIQSMGKKAVYENMRILGEPTNRNPIETHILILIINNIAYVLLDVTGDPLHKRGYRTESGEAPIKENLAAALVAFSGWRYKSPLFDPCAGSGTIPIEAAMMARNIAPGIKRHFRIEDLPFHDAQLFENIQVEANTKSYPSGSYRIFTQDIDPAMIHIAESNARRAGVSEDITFLVGDTLDTQGTYAQFEGTTITNPPYGKRLE